MTDFDAKLGAFITQVNELIQGYIAKSGYKHLIEANWHVAVEPNSKGKKFIRLVHMEHGAARSVYCFVDTTNGNLLKGSWKAPVKNGVRGNIFDRDAIAHFTHYGPAYLR